MEKITCQEEKNPRENQWNQLKSPNLNLDPNLQRKVLRKVNSPRQPNLQKKK